MARADFHARIARIERDRRNPKRGNEGTALGRLLRNMLWPLSVPGAVLLGLALVVFARYARFHLIGLPLEPTPETLSEQMWGDLAVAFAISFVMRLALQWKSTLHTMAQGLGMLVGALCFHMAVHRFPDLFEVTFSRKYVRFITQTTDADAILVFAFSAT
ncbi:MAG: hypothetical protein MK107_03110 [Oceanicola sp.]|nr:hypothetical protein [Oceanicola sp.]